MSLKEISDSPSRSSIENVISTKTEFYRKAAIEFFQFLHEAINEAKLFLEDSKNFVRDLAEALMSKSKTTGKTGLEEIAENFTQISNGLLAPSEYEKQD